VCEKVLEMSGCGNVDCQVIHVICASGIIDQYLQFSSLLCLCVRVCACACVCVCVCVCVCLFQARPADYSGVCVQRVHRGRLHLRQEEVEAPQ